MAFVEEMFELIIKKLRSRQRYYADGEEGQGKNCLDLFDYESVMQSSVLVELRSQNLTRFLKEVIEDVIMHNIDLDKRKKKLNDCRQMFSHELLLLSLRGEYLLEERATKMYKKMESDVKNKQEQDILYKKKEKVKDNINMFLLRLVLSELCARLQTTKPHDIIRIYGKNGK